MSDTHASTISLNSPDQKFQANIKHADEIAMGAPTSGILRLNIGGLWESCNPSMVWSSDSRYLAVPQWTSKTTQKLMVIDVIEHHTYYARQRYSVLQLENFTGNIIEGFDIKRKIRIELNEILKNIEEAYSNDISFKFK